MSDPRIPVEDLQRSIEWLYRAAGVDEPCAAAVASAIVDASTRGIDSHGVVLVPRYVRGLMTGGLNPRPHLEWIVEAGAVAELEADNAPGHLAAHTAMKKCIEIAKANGCATVLVRNSNHFGMAAHYALMAAEAGLIGIVGTNGPPVMAPFGGITPTIANNPVAFAIPRSGDHVVLDMALSVGARGRIRNAALAGLPIPEGWATDKDDVPTTDAKKALEGNLQWVGTYKGYGLGVIFEILAGVLSGSRFGTDVPDTSVKAPSFAPAVPLRHGHFMVAIDPDRFLSKEDFATGVSTLEAMLKASALAKGSDAIKLPGEPEWATMRARRSEGIPVAQTLLDELRLVAAELMAAGADAGAMPETLRPQ